MLRSFHLARQLWAIALFLAFGVAQAERLVCAEEQRLELVSEHRAELSSQTSDAQGPVTEHCCPCVHTFVSTERRVAVSVAQPIGSTTFTFLQQDPAEHTAAPLLPPPIA